MDEETLARKTIDIPQTFRVSKRRRVFVLLTSIPIAIFIIGIVGALIIKGPGGNVLNLVLILTIVLGNCLIFIPRFLRAFSTSLTIDPERIQSLSSWKRHELLLDDIAGFEVNRDGDEIILRPKDPEKKAMTVSVHLEQFGDISRWIRKNFKNLSAALYESEISEILTSEHYGQDKKERREYYEIALLRAKSMNIFAIGVSVWTFIYPEPYEFAIIASALLPIIAVGVIISSKNLIRLDSHTWSAHPHVARAFLMPVFALFFRAFFDYTILSTDALWLPLCLSVIVFSVILFSGIKEFRSNKRAILPVIVFIIIFIYGVLVEANCLFDSQPPQISPAVVNNKRIRFGLLPVWHQLTISETGGEQSTREEHISRELFEILEKGDNVCIEIRPGLLGIPWYRLAECEK